MTETQESSKHISIIPRGTMSGAFPVLLFLLLSLPSQAYTTATTGSSYPSFVVGVASTSSSSSLMMASSTSTIPKKKNGYEPKWKKLQTLSDKEGSKGFQEVGLKGTIPVVFRQGTDERKTVGLPGQPIREVAIQAGQFIKYGCGKGECGTCECLMNGQWIRPCSTNLPIALDNGMEELVIQVKEVKNKSKSSGKFYSLKSFFMGFKNNLLGMVGLVKYRKNAKQNYCERMEYENLIKQKALEKKLLKQQQLAQQQQQGSFNQLQP